MTNQKDNAQDKTQPDHVHSDKCDHNHDHEKQEKMGAEIRDQINKDLDALSKIEDFKEYFKAQREIIKKYIGTWQYVEANLERNASEDYKLMLRSFGQKAELDKENNKIEKEKFDVIKKFNEQIEKTLSENNYELTSQQLFYVLLGNVLEHTGQSDIDMKKFNIQQDLYPKLQFPLGLAFFLFQNLTFGPISKKINELSDEYLNKYSALLLALWRTVFELMRYEKDMAKQKAEASKKKVDKKEVKKEDKK